MSEATTCDDCNREVPSDDIATVHSTSGDTDQCSRCRGLGDQRHERDAKGALTDWALACNALVDNGCDCGEDEEGTCLACVCERAMRAERKRAEFAEAHHRRYADGIAGALREHRAYRDTGEPACSDVNAIRVLVANETAERVGLLRIEDAAEDLGCDPGAESVADFMRRVCRERDEARALAGRLVDNGDRP